MTAKRIFAVGFFCALSVLAGCQRKADEPLKVTARTFVFNYRVATATYLVTLARNAPLPDEAYAETRYENPAGGDPILVRSRIFPFWQKVALESPPVHCIVKDRPYMISIRVVDSQGKILQSIETSVTSDQNQSVLPAQPLVIGPVYTPNPDVFKPDGSADFSPEKGCEQKP